MKVGIIGTSAIAEKHAQAYRNIGYNVVACANRDKERGRRFAEKHGSQFVEDWEDLCSDSRIDFVDLCTFPGFRLEPLSRCACAGKPLLVEKPIAVNLEIARQMVATAAKAGITFGVVSQHRFDEPSRFLEEALRHGRLGRILQCDCYVKWHRSRQYYDRPEKGSWKTEGGGALINQAIHQIDLIRWLAGPVKFVFGQWRIAATHRMEAEDIAAAIVRYESDAIGVIQGATAFWPGYSERIEIHGTKGSAIVIGNRLAAWDVENDEGEPPPLGAESQSGASDPMAVSLDSFERQFRDFGEAVRLGRKPLVSGEDGFNALAVVSAIYDSCRSGSPVAVEKLSPVVG